MEINTQNVAGVVGSLGGLLAVAGFFQWRVAHNHLLAQLMAWVHDRYASTSAKLAGVDLSKCYAGLSDVELAAIADYVNLCAEEYFWREKRHSVFRAIPDEVWAVWVSGMKEKIAFPAVREAWQNDLRNDDYYDGFQSFFDGLLQAQKAELRD